MGCVSFHTQTLEKIRFSITRLKHYLIVCCSRVPLCLEKIRFSITRLKQCFKLRWKGIALTWKDKILDYEIETANTDTRTVKILLSWKDKILDYEIETLQSWSLLDGRTSTWKDKILDYEIETPVVQILDEIAFFSLKR